MDPGMTLHEIAHLSTAMDGSPVPQKHHRTFKMPEKTPQETSDIQAVEAAGLHPEV